MTKCARGFDANTILAAFDELDHEAIEHAASCPSCKDVVRLRSLARDVWNDAKHQAAARSAISASVNEDEDDLRRRWESPAPSSTSSSQVVRVPLRVAVMFAVVPLAAAALIVGLTRRPSTTTTTTTETATANSAPVVVVAPPPPELSRREEPKRSPEPAIIARSLTVPEGSHVMLGFAIPEGTAELIGPATAETSDTALTLRRGTVNVRDLRAVTVHLPSSGAKVDPNGAVCSVAVDDRGTVKVKVESGHPIVTNRAGATTHLNPGSAFEIAAPPLLVAPTAPTTTVASNSPTTPTEEAAPAHVAAPAPSPDAVVRREALAAGISGSSSATTPEDALATARARLRSGDSMGARADLEKLAGSADGRTARRASFTLAEMDLSPGGDRSKALLRLKDLVVCPEAQLGADAATLLARTTATPVERADVWRRYLATNPPPPHLDRARLARAEALLDAGQIVEARVLLDDVKKSPATNEGQKKELERLLFKAREMH